MPFKKANRNVFSEIESLTGQYENGWINVTVYWYVIFVLELMVYMRVIAVLYKNAVISCSLLPNKKGSMQSL